jgi:cobaltochelatase CobT
MEVQKMNHSTAIDMELNFLAAQADADDLPGIQKLSPAQLAALASTLGRKHGVKVEFGSFNTAATDGTRIVMPLSSKENSWLVRGYLDHELGHLRLTGFDTIPQEPFRRSLWNALEDIRIEAAMPLHYPGMASNYRALIREMIRTTPELFEIDEAAAPDNKIVAYISIVLRALYLKQTEMAASAIKAREIFISTFGDALEQELFQVIFKIDSAKHPQDVLDLVDEIIALLEQNAQEQQPDSDSDEDKGDNDVPEQQESNNDDNDENGKDGEAPDDAPEDDDNNETPDSASVGPSDGNPETGADEDNFEQSGDSSNLEPPGDSSNLEPPGDSSNLVETTDNAQPVPRQELIQDALDAPHAISDLGEQLRLLVEHNEYLSGDSGLYEIGRRATDAELKNVGYMPREIKASSTLLANLSSRLRGLLQSHNLKQSTPGMSGSRIARNRLHRIKTGDPKLFLKKAPQRMINTAIHILIDNSCSMNDYRRFYKAKDVVLGLVKALEPIPGVNLAVSLFPAFYPYYRAGEPNVKVPVATVLPHGRNRPEYAILYAPAPHGGTPLGPSLRYVTTSMLGLSEPRRIIFIITDGEPDSTTATEIAIQEACDLGFQVVALGIDELACSEIFPQFEILQSLNELPQKTFSLLEKLLLPN